MVFASFTGEEAGLLGSREFVRLAAENKPFFLFLRHMDPHAPYLPPRPFERMFYDGDEFDPANKSLAMQEKQERLQKIQRLPVH